MLSNLETEKSKLLQIVLVGQPNLRDKLARARARAAAPADHGQLSPAAARRGRNGPTTSTTGCAAPRSGAPLEFPRDVTDLDPRAQPRRAADHQRDLRRRAGVRLRRRAPPDRCGARCAKCSASWKARACCHGRSLRSRRSSSRRDSPCRRCRGHVEPRGRGRRRPRRVLDARHWPPTAARAVDDGARTAALDQREQTLRQRERELAEQRRVLAEEYRLLRVTAGSRAGPRPPP